MQSTHKHMRIRIHSTRGQMDLADPSHPSSNPLILGMSQCAGCKATGQRAPIRKMAGFDASRGTGDRKSKRMAQYHPTGALNTRPHGLAGPYLSTWDRYLGEGPLLLSRYPTPSLLGLGVATMGELTLVNLAVSPCVLWGVGCTYLIPSGRDVIIGRCSSFGGAQGWVADAVSAYLSTR